MNPSAITFKPNQKKSYPILADLLTKAELNIFQDLLHEWADTPTLDLLLDNWSNHRDKADSMMSIKQNVSLLLLNVSSLNRYFIDAINLVDSMQPPIVVLNGTHHDENSVKQFISHFFNFNVFSMKGSNVFGGVLIAVHKSIRSQRVAKFNNLPNIIVLEIGSDTDMFQLVTCYSPPAESIPLDLFDRLLQHNPNSIFTGDLNAKHSSRSKSIENRKGRALLNWLSSSQAHTSLEIINKYVPTSTRSTATIDIIIAPTHMSSKSFSVLATIRNDHHPVLWHPSFKMSSTVHYYPIKRTRWNLLEVFLTCTGLYWHKLATSMSHSVAFFVLYERFLSLCVSRLTTITFRKTIRPSLPPHIVVMIDQKRRYLKSFRQTRHPYFARVLRDMAKLIQKQLFLHKRKSWLAYCNSLNDCDTTAFWKKARRHFISKSAPIEGFIANNEIASSPMHMCTIAKLYYEEQFSSHQFMQSETEIEANNADIEIEEALRNKPPIPIQITYQHLRRSVASLKNKNSTGIDGISNRIIKLLPPNHLSIILSCLNNFAVMLQTPSHWHVAKMILLSKKKSKVIAIDETRPISLLPCFLKII
ncbi:unnamed protein product [Rotaria socialis]|uniref:Endonuclease/exonuclease/phosphatase domain-containing protein n=1 Tax=Rotaria socialis TaxID=392032 RepID=A0A817S1S9_9BILA|nr:unnamed protein product [Rotaria socialis]CAF4512585.1 unnamed protein product [Rotaria socialis]